MFLNLALAEVLVEEEDEEEVACFLVRLFLEVNEDMLRWQTEKIARFKLGDCGL